MPVIPQDSLVLISFLVTIVSHKIRTDQLSDGANSLIAGASMILIAIITAWMATGFTPDLRADALLIGAMLVSLFPIFKEFLDILGYQYQAQSPLAPPTPFVPPTH